VWWSIVKTVSCRRRSIIFLLFAPSLSLFYLF
jgi:hypothetical protein